jgi:shikimate dehydrogenase
MGHTIRLGLIGDNIGASRAPKFHVLAGRQNDVTVSYERLVPAELGQDFDTLFDRVAAAGFHGINVTYPYKERAARRVRIGDPLLRGLGAVNTVLFRPDGPEGFNTDHSGFMAAWRHAFGDRLPGTVLLIGAGGVGRAIGFALAALGAKALRIADTDPGRADALALALRGLFPKVTLQTGADAAAMARGANGLVNATPLGMVGYGGTPLAARAMAGASWAFDAVYTPVDTPFLIDAKGAGIEIISGFELFIGQGVDAWRLFTGMPLDMGRLRADLEAEAAA